MKLTTELLKQLIKEEIENLNEVPEGYHQESKEWQQGYRDGYYEGKEGKIAQRSRDMAAGEQYLKGYKAGLRTGEAQKRPSFVKGPVNFE